MAKVMDMRNDIFASDTRRETIDHYRKEGWAKLGRVLSDEDLAIARDILVQRAQKDAEAAAQDGWGSPMRSMFRGGTNLRFEHPELKRIVAKTANIARDLLGEDVRILWDSAFVKDPTKSGGRETAWHQDWPHTRGLDRRGMMSMWIAIFDVPEQSGCLKFVPRSHRIGPLGRLDIDGETYDLPDILRKEDFDIVGAPLAVPLQAGEATVHDGLTLHGAGLNLSDSPRIGWVNVFTPATTKWNGAPFPVEHLNTLGLQMLEPIDHPDLRVD